MCIYAPLPSHPPPNDPFLPNQPPIMPFFPFLEHMKSVLANQHSKYSAWKSPVFPPMSL